jgi:hypothetical protein
MHRESEQYCIMPRPLQHCAIPYTVDGAEKRCWCVLEMRTHSPTSCFSCRTSSSLPVLQLEEAEAEAADDADNEGNEETEAGRDSVTL